MNDFWFFTRQMLQYKRLIALALGAAMMDALCAFGGFGSLMWVINTLLGKQQSLKDAVTQKLDVPWIHTWFGNLDPILAKLPDDPFTGFAYLLGVILILTIIGTLFRFLYQYWSITVSYRAVMQIRKQVFHRLVHVSLASISMENTGHPVSV